MAAVQRFEMDALVMTLELSSTCRDPFLYLTASFRR